MKTVLRQIFGPWDAGWVLDKHMLHSTYLGDNAQGHPTFENTRTEVGEAVYQLKYRDDWSQVEPLAQSVVDSICQNFPRIGFVVPMPASNVRPRQPVTAVATQIGKLIDKPVFTDLLLKAPTGRSLKNITSKEEKIEAIENSFSVQDIFTKAGPWNVLVVDDLFHTGASMEAACEVLRAYSKVRKIFVAALTWR